MSNSQKTREVHGDILSPGSAQGILFLCEFSGKSRVQASSMPLEPGAEIKRVEKELDSLIHQLERSIEVLQQEGYPREAEIIHTHLYLLKDTRFRNDILKTIQTNKIAAETAVDRILNEMIEAFERSKNAVFSERAGDIRDILSQLTQRLAQQKQHRWDFIEGLGAVIIAVDELTPSVLLEARRRKAAGFVVRKGTALSHSIILAKSFGIPVIRIASFHGLEAHHLKPAQIDAAQGCVIFDPSEGDRRRIQTRPAVAAAESFGDLPIRLWVNIAGPQQVTADLMTKITGIGLYRTESVFMEQMDTFPSEQQQVAIYRPLFETCRDIPVIFRTADIGGDKELSYFSLGPQQNPYLGLRAHRIFRYHPEIFITQLKAALKAAVDATQVKILYPMIETTDEWMFIQDLVSQTRDALKQEGAAYQDHFQQGVMVEVPSLVWDFDRILDYADFASVGTNDLFQYFFAADRNNPNAHSSFQPKHPVSLRLLKYLIETAEAKGKPLHICGEIASDLRFLPLLIGLGFQDISIDSHRVDEVGRFISQLDPGACRRLAEKCLAVKTSAQVKTLLQEFMPAPDETSEKRKHGNPIDPVCGMMVSRQTAPASCRYKDKMYYFCAEVCRDKFESDPKHYTEKWPRNS